MSFEQENERRFAWGSAEGRESGMEGRKENRDENLEKKLAAKERVEQMAREVKTTQKQMQNIMGNMQQVVKAVQLIRQQLGLAARGGAIPSVARDAATVAALQKKLAKLQGEITDLQAALAYEYAQEISRDHREWSQEEIQRAAEAEAKAMLRSLGFE